MIMWTNVQCKINFFFNSTDKNRNVKIVLNSMP